MSRPPLTQTATATDNVLPMRSVEANALIVSGPEALTPEVVEFNPEIAGMQLNALATQAIWCLFESGRILAEAHEKLRHGEWTPWLQRWWPGTERGARERMELFRLIGDRTELLKQLEGVPLRKANTILKLPAEDIAELEKTGTIGGLQIEEIKARPHADLVKELARAKSTEESATKALSVARAEQAKLEAQLNKANARIAALTEAPPPDKREAVLLEQLREAQATFFSAMLAYGRAFDAAVPLFTEAREDMEREVRRPRVSGHFCSTVTAHTEYAAHLAAYERTRFRILVGSEEDAVDYKVQLGHFTRLETIDERLRLPSGRKIVGMPDSVE